MYYMFKGGGIYLNYNFPQYNMLTILWTYFYAVLTTLQTGLNIVENVN